MSENILKALTNLFGIITKQAGGATARERDFVVNYFREQLDEDSINTYSQLYDQVAEYGKPGPDKITMKESVKILNYCKQINSELEQGQKVLIVVKLLELVASDGNFSKQRREIIDTVSSAFNFDKEEYKAIEGFVLSTQIYDFNHSTILVASKEKPFEVTAFKHLIVPELEGNIVFLHVKSADIYFVKYLGEELPMLNGFPLKNQITYLYPSGSSIKTQQARAVYYSDVTSIFLESHLDTRVSFTANDIEFKFPNGALGLRGVFISEPQGRLVGIMGGSGAGKTTLLNVLSGIEKPSKGEVLINGINIHENRKKVEGVIGYVAQDDLLIEELTVYQNLYYNAKLCFGDMSEKDIDERVIDVLGDLGLDHIKDLKVGNVLNKKISGGQRKRLNIALELIRQPAVLFVDEPTSGLSSRDSENVMDLLKELSLKGKLIFVVIHQPSVEIYRMFDKMVILDKGGYPVYYGNPLEAITYFKKETNQVEGDKSNLNPEQVFNLLERQVVNEYGQYTNKRKISPEGWNEKYKQNIEPSLEAVETINEKPPTSIKLPSLIIQTFIFTIRDFLSKISNQQYMLINLLEAPVLAFLLSYVIRFQNDPEEEGKYNFMYNDNIPAYVLICIIISLFMGLTVSAEEIIRDRKIQKRERFLNLSRAAYLVSKVFILFSLSAIQTFTFVLIGNSVLSIDGELMNYWIVLFSVSCFANMLGLNISSTFNSVVTIYITIPLLLIPQMIMSGIIFKYDKMNQVIADKDKVPLLADIMVSRWAYEAIAVNNFRHNYYEIDYYDLEKEESINRVLTKYWVPNLKNKVDDLVKNQQMKKREDSVQKKYEKDLRILRNELNRKEDYKKYLTGINPEEDITEEKFNEKIAERIRTYLDKVDKDATKKMNNAAKERDKIYDEFKEADSTYDDLKAQYFNLELARLVKKEESLLNGLIEGNDKLVQMIDPIYHEPSDAEGWYDYRTHFLAPKKHFAGFLFDTYYYNLTVIWLFTILLYITLYYDAVKNLSNITSKISFNKIKSKKINK
ncbi:MAG: ATP-binding cassette domain-containing protein [Cytophagales bacterium]|nr:MAG: ATP-binding cassette domain-containing protein [Cytophagales bacterium]